ncbi:hypothetical protein JCM10207_008307 [Rhodosporidiobolus poonsookiae]
MAALELHIDTAATQDVFVAQHALPPNALPGDLVAIRPVVHKRSKGKGKDQPLLYKVDKPPEVDEAKDQGVVGLARRRAKAQVTVTPTVAQSFGWIKNRIEIELTLIPSPPPRKICASHVELYFNNMYLSRPDSFSLSLALAGRVLHTGQRVVLPGSGARLRVGDIYSASSRSSSSSSSRHGSSSSRHTMNTSLQSAYITDETKFIYRSESARHYIFVEVSQELWQFEEDGSMLLEKAELFLQELFAHYSGKMTPDAEDKRSKGIPTSHVTTIILYGRVIYDDEEDAEEARAPLCRLENGTLYRDFYKVILDLTPSPPQSIIHTVALELRRWQESVLLRTLPDGSEKLSGRLANAHESPVLEATNLALNSFEEHWIDRDLQRTGLEIIVMTAGSSFYQVEKNLLRLTTERMLFHGIGLDLISLSKMPLHTVPLFQFRSEDPQAVEQSRNIQPDTASISGGAGAGGKESLSSAFHAAPPGTSFPNSHRSPANFGHRFPHGPSSFRDRPIASSPLRDPHALDPAVEAAARLPPVVIPEDQRDPLYFDPPAAPALRSGLPHPHPQGNHSRHPSAHSALALHTPSFSASPAFPSSSAPSNPPPLALPGPVTAPSTLSGAPPPAPATTPQLYYAEPLFVFPHFFGTQLDKPHRIDRFMPRARCYELFVQGVSARGRAPIAIPLLPPLAGGGGENEGGAAWLSELERRMHRRERYDALAVGARDPDELGDGNGDGAVGTRWELRESGALVSASASASASASSGAGTSASASEGDLSRRASEASTGGEGTTTEESEADDERFPRRDRAGARALGVGLPGRMAAAERSESRRRSSGARTARRATPSRSRKSASSVSSAAVGTDESQDDAAGDSDDEGARGRQAARAKVAELHKPSSGRSKTPVPHAHQRFAATSRRREESVVRGGAGARTRSGSVAASVRTVSSVNSRATDAHGAGSSLALRKASTPALIARLTGGLAPPAGSPSAASPSSTSPARPASSASSTIAAPAAAPARPSWLNLFGRSSASTAQLTSASPTATPPSRISKLASPPSSTVPLPPLPSISTAPSATPQVAVARVDVQANLKPEWAGTSVADTSSDGTSATTGTGTGVVLGFSSASQRPSSRSRTRAEEARARVKGGKTQPISIGGKEGEKSSSGGAGGAGKADGGGGGGKDRNGSGVSSGTGVGGKGMSSSSLKMNELDGSGVRRAFGLGSANGSKIHVAERFNPSKPGKRSHGLADQARRWAGILIAERRSLKLGVKWRSLTRGACLPITTDYLPTVESLQTQYSEYRYTVPTGAVTSSPFLRTDHPKRSHILTLVTELICQRLSQGFQICTPANAVGALDSITFATSKTLPDVLRDIQDGEVTAVYLSLSNQVHRVWYDRRTQSVFVKILRRRRTWAKVEYSYNPLIWTRGNTNYDFVSRLAFPYPTMIEPVDWQHGDRLVAGAEKPDAQQTTRYRRTRLVLLPAAKVPDRDYIISVTKVLQGGEASDATIQAQGFYALMDLVENARWAPAGIEKEPLPIAQTTLDAPGWAASVAEAQAAEAAASASQATAPAQHPRTTWLSRMGGGRTKTDDAPSTPQSERDLELPATAAPTTGREAVAALNRSETSGSLSTITGSLSGPGSGNPSFRRPIVAMTHAVVLDLDKTKQSDRAERVLCHLDRSHNTQAAYHLELAWLTASGKNIDNTIQSWTRQMARYGLTLVEVSTRPVLARHNPLEKPAMVRLALQPPSALVDVDDEEDAVREEQEKPSRTEHYLSRLLRSLDYFLDLGADSTFPSSIDVQYSYRRTPTRNSQFIHRSGSLLVSIFEDDEGPGLAYAPNRIYTSHKPDADPGKVVEQLERMCADADRLEAFWREVDERV